MGDSTKGVTGENYFREISDLLSHEECKHLIAISEQTGYLSTQRNKYNDKIDNTAIRSDDHVSLTNASLTKSLMSRMRANLPKRMHGRPLRGLEPKFKFNRYSVGQDFKPHNDTCLVKDKQQSSLTLIIYLNSDFTGGQTRFFEIETMQHVDVYAETGKAVIFDQDLYHAGLKVKSGTKYTVRLDVMYGRRRTKKPKKSSHKSRHIRHHTPGRFSNGRRD